MAAPMNSHRMLQALKAEGLSPKEYPGWATHHRNHKGPWGPVHGIVIHHTAGTNSLRLVHDGMAGLPGPLAHAHLAKDGTLTLTGHGRANHAGTIAANAHDAVIRESRLHPGPDRSEPIDGNRHYYGIEIENRGDGKDPYPSSQYKAAVRWAAAICRAHGWTEDSVVGHKEVTTRKIDPTFSMEDFRKAVAAQLRTTPGTVVKPKPLPQEDEVPYTPALLALASSAVSNVAANQWHDIVFDTEHNDPSHIHSSGSHLVGREDALYSGVLYLRVLNANAGTELHVRLAEEDADGNNVKEHPIAEMVATAQSTYFAAPFTGQLPDVSGRRLKFQFQHNDTSPVTIERVELKSLWWLS